MPALVAFPSDAQRLERDLAELHGRTIDQRVEALLEICRLCEDLRKSSPTADLQRQLIEEREQEENAIWRQFLRTHG